MENKDVKDENKGLELSANFSAFAITSAIDIFTFKVRKKKILHSKRLEDLIGCGGIEIESIPNRVVYEAETKEDNIDIMYYGGIPVDPTYILSKGISSPILTTDEVRKAFKVNTNRDLFKKIFTEEEVTEMATAILNLKGGSFTVEKELKN